MSEDGRERYELPKQIGSSFAQARTGLEKFLAGAQATAGSIAARGATVRAGVRDIGATSAEANVQGSPDFAQARACQRPA